MKTEATLILCACLPGDGGKKTQILTPTQQKCRKNPLTRSRLDEDNWLEPIIFVIYRLSWEKLNDLVNLYFQPEQGYGQQCVLLLEKLWSRVIWCWQFGVLIQMSGGSPRAKVLLYAGSVFNVHNSVTRSTVVYLIYIYISRLLNLSLPLFGWVLFEKSLRIEREKEKMGRSLK